MFLIGLSRLFQALDAATGNARSPRVERRVDGIIKDKLSADRRPYLRKAVLFLQVGLAYSKLEPFQCGKIENFKHGKAIDSNFAYGFIFGFDQ